jgi:uncharacterized protein YerC
MSTAKNQSKNNHYLTKALAKILAHQPAPQTFELLRQILTDKELEYVERRLRIAMMLRQGSPYTKIQEDLKVSAATVAIVADQMKQPDFTGLVNKLEKETARFKWLRERLTS